MVKARVWAKSNSSVGSDGYDEEDNDMKSLVCKMVLDGDCCDEEEVDEDDEEIGL